MSIDKIANLLVVITLFEMMVAIGLRVSIRDVAGVVTNIRVVTRAGLANYVLVPAITVLLLWLFHASSLVSAGILLAAVCPGAPYAPPLTGIAKGNMPISVGLMVVLAGSSAILAPLLLGFLLPLIARDADLRINVVKMVGTLLITQLLPLSLGLLIRFKRPSLADRLQKPANVLSGVLNLILFTLIIALQYQTLAQIRAKGFVGMCSLVILSLVAGWVVGGGPVDDRRAVALTTATRNVGVALVIASASFPGSLALTAVVIYAIIQTFLLALLALLLGRFAPTLQVT